MTLITSPQKYLNDYTAAVAKQTIAGMQRAVEQGRPVGPIPIGYQRDHAKNVEVDPLTAPLVELAFRLVGRGMSLREALEHCTTAGLSSRTGKPIALSTFHQMLTNPFYCGQLTFRGQVYRGSHPAIISKTLFERVRQKRRRRRRN